MSNIYLRLPKYTAAYYRTKNQDNILTEFMPIIFCKYTTEYHLMEHHLHNSGIDHNPKCFSQSAWNNLLHGKSSDGKIQMLNRDAKKWLTMQEIDLLEKDNHTERKDTYDYLCIETPKEICIRNQFVVVDNMFSMSPFGARKLSDHMQKQFYYDIIEWIKKDREYCMLKNLPFIKTTSLEGFMAEYDLPNSKDNHERDTLKRNINRFTQTSSEFHNDKYFK